MKKNLIAFVFIIISTISFANTSNISKSKLSLSNLNKISNYNHKHKINTILLNTFSGLLSHCVIDDKRGNSTFHAEGDCKEVSKAYSAWVRAQR